MQLMISLVISVTLHVRNEWVIPILISSITNPIMAYSADPSTRMFLLNPFRRLAVVWHSIEETGI
jgi:hypothetical protein